MVPTNPHADAQSIARKKINIGRLARDERRLTLRKDKDASRETDSLRNPSQVREHHEWVMEWVVLGVRAHELGRPIGVDCAEHVVVSEEVIKAEIFNRPTNEPDCAWVAS